MELQDLRSILGWCTLINYALLLWWFAVFAVARDWLRGVHGRWFTIPDEQFDALHYGLMALMKIGIFVFNLVPYIALHIVA